MRFSICCAFSFQAGARVAESLPGIYAAQRCAAMCLRRAQRETCAAAEMKRRLFLPILLRLIYPARNRITPSVRRDASSRDIRPYPGTSIETSTLPLTRGRPQKVAMIVREAPPEPPARADVIVRSPAAVRRSGAIRATPPPLMFARRAVYSNAAAPNR